MSNFASRTLVAIVGLPVVLGVLWLGGWWLFSLVAVAACVAVHEYVTTARAKGVSEFGVVFVHALRNAILPIITITGLHFGNLLSGAVLVETVFNWPGLGTLAFDSILRRDYPTILGLLFFSSVMVVVANILTEACYAWADPRIKSGGAA